VREILRTRTTDVDVLFGDVIASITQSDDGVEVAFGDGHARTFDLVVGADGLHSNVRRQVFGDESRYLRDLGMYLCVYSVPNYLHLDRMEEQYSEVGRIAAIWSTRDDANAKACFGFAARDRQIDRALPNRLRDRPGPRARTCASILGRALFVRSRSGPRRLLAPARNGDSVYPRRLASLSLRLARACHSAWSSARRSIPRRADLRAARTAPSSGMDSCPSSPSW
jgi:hypothetical protein